MFYDNLIFSNDGLYLITQVNDVNIALDEQVLAEVLGVPTEGTRSLKDESGFEIFLNLYGKSNDFNIKNFTKKSPKGGYQLLFEQVNKALLPRIEKYIVFTGLDLFLMEALAKFKHINLSGIIIKHIHKVIMAKDGKHELVYGFWLNKVFAYFEVQCGPEMDVYIKKMFIVST